MLNLRHAKRLLASRDMKSLCLLLALACYLVPMTLRAELAPSAYEAMQAKAPEFLKIEVLRVDVSPGDDPIQQKIQIVALVSDVTRTASDLKANDVINISYVVTEHPKGWVGPGEVPIPVAKDQCVAYLVRGANTDYAPAAGRMTFSQF
jgi:hypothetical protein